MNPLEILTKLIDNPRTSGGAIVAAVGLWLLTSYGIGVEGDVTIKYVALGITVFGVLLLGFGASDAKNTVLKSEVDKLDANKPITPQDLTQKQPDAPLKVEIVNDADSRKP